MADVRPLTEGRSSFHIWLRQQNQNEPGINVIIIITQVSTAEWRRDKSISVAADPPLDPRTDRRADGSDSAVLQPYFQTRFESVDKVVSARPTLASRATADHGCYPETSPVGGDGAFGLRKGTNQAPEYEPIRLRGRNQSGWLTNQRPALLKLTTSQQNMMTRVKK